MIHIQDSTDSSSKKTQFKSISLPSSKNETQASKNDKNSTNSEVVKEPSKKEICILHVLTEEENR